jgi:hypothetical protein
MPSIIVAYELTLVGACLPHEDGKASQMIQDLYRVVRQSGGDAVDVWSYQFPTFSHARAASHAIRQLGLTFDDLSIVTVNQRTGRALRH